MTNQNQVRREMEILRRALGPEREKYKRFAEETNRFLHAYDRMLEENTRGMTLQQKREFEHNLAKQTAKDYAEGKLWQVL